MDKKYIQLSRTMAEQCTKERLIELYLAEVENGCEVEDKLKLTQKALELACKWINNIQKMDSDCPIYADCFRVEKDCDNWDCKNCDCSKFSIDHFTTKASEVIESESNT